MADLVSLAIADLQARLDTIDVVKNKSVYIYTQDELLDEKKNVGLPAIGVVYVATRAAEDNGLSADIICDIYLLGGDKCSAVVGQTKVTSTDILDKIRDAIKCNTFQQVGARRKWTFMIEQPAPVSKDYVSYMQRWKTRVVLTS